MSKIFSCTVTVESLDSCLYCHNVPLHCEMHVVHHQPKIYSKCILFVTLQEETRLHVCCSDHLYVLFLNLNMLVISIISSQHLQYLQQSVTKASQSISKSL